MGLGLSFYGSSDCRCPSPHSAVAAFEHRSACARVSPGRRPCTQGGAARGDSGTHELRSRGAGGNSRRAARYEPGCSRDGCVADPNRRQWPRRACARVGPGRRPCTQAGPLEGAAVRMCCEAGARVATHVGLRDMNLDAPVTDGWQIQIVGNGHGAQAPHPELLSPGRVRCRLVVLGMEISGRISNGAAALLIRLARVKARQRAPWAAS